MDKKSYIVTKKTYKGKVEGRYIVTSGSAEGEVTEEYEGPAFLYGCKFCGTPNQCSKPGNSCGSKKCNEAWDEERGIFYKGAKFVYKQFK